MAPPRKITFKDFEWNWVHFEGTDDDFAIWRKDENNERVGFRLFDQGMFVIDVASQGAPLGEKQSTEDEDELRAILMAAKAA